MPEELKARLEEAATGSHRTTTAEIVERLFKSFDTADIDELRTEYWDMHNAHYEERKQLLDAINNQERVLQTLRSQHNNFVIIAKALGDAILKDTNTKSESVQVLAEMLVNLEEDSSSDLSDPVPDPYYGYPGPPPNWPDPTDK